MPDSQGRCDCPMCTVMNGTRDWKRQWRDARAAAINHARRGVSEARTDRPAVTVAVTDRPKNG